MVTSNNNSTTICLDEPSTAGIVWLASYPKSGNTWFRAFLSNLCNSTSEPVDINKLGNPWGISRCQFDRFCGLDSSLLLPEEIEALWPEVVVRVSNELGAFPASRVLKTHGAYHAPAVNPFFIAPCIDRAIYLVRNPFDVCVSFAHHSTWSFDKTIKVMGDKNYTMCQRYNQRNPAFPEQVSSWSANVKSWIYTKDFSVLVIRYEDLLDDPMALFESAVKYLKIHVAPEIIRKAVVFSDFDVLQGQENKTGFWEKGSKTNRFFRQGQEGNWKKVLSKNQILKLLHDHGDVMEAMNYSTNIV